MPGSYLVLQACHLSLTHHVLASSQAEPHVEIPFLASLPPHTLYSLTEMCHGPKTGFKFLLSHSPPQCSLPGQPSTPASSTVPSGYHIHNTLELVWCLSLSLVTLLEHCLLNSESPYLACWLCYQSDRCYQRHSYGLTHTWQKQDQQEISQGLCLPTNDPETPENPQINSVEQATPIGQPETDLLAASL